MRTAEHVAISVVSDWFPRTALLIASCGLIVGSVFDIFSLSLALSLRLAFSIRLVCLHYKTKKCDSTPGIILQQFNFMSDVEGIQQTAADAYFRH